MTQAEILAMARGFARVSTSGLSDANANLLIEQAHCEVAKDLNGIPKRSYVQIGALFYISTDMRFRMTIAGTGDTLAATDIQISATALSGSTGTTVATALQAAIRTATGGTGTTVAWTNYYFTITTTGATSQTIVAPTGVAYSDATGLLFGSADTTQTGTAWTGDFPEDCTIEASLPSDYHEMEKVNWDAATLQPAPREFFVRPQCTGDPFYYFIRNDKLYLYPVPTTQDILYIEYRSVPVPTYFTSTTYTPDMPVRYHMLIVLLTTYYMLMGTHETQLAREYYGKYLREKNRCLVNKNNQVTTRIPDDNITHPYKVIV